MKTINVELNVDNKDAVKSVNQLEEELEQLREEFGKVEIGSKEFNRLGNAIKKTEQQVKDIELQFEALDREQRIVAVTDSFTGLVGVVEIGAGALAAFGVESEAFEDIEKRVVGLIGVVQGLQAAQEGVIAVTKLVGPAFAKAGAGIRAALAATGIGLLVVALGTVITYWEDINELITGTPGEKRLKFLREELEIGKLQLRNLDRRLEKELELSTTTIATRASLERYISKIGEEINKLTRQLNEGIGDEKLREEVENQLDTLKKKRQAAQKIYRDNILKTIDDQYAAELVKLQAQGKDTRQLELKIAREKLEQIKRDGDAEGEVAKQLGLQILRISTELETERTKKKNAEAAKRKAISEEEAAITRTYEDIGIKGLEKTTTAEEEYTNKMVDFTNIRINATEMEESKRQEIREQRRKERQAEFKEDAEAFQGQVSSYANYAQGVANNIRKFQEQNAEVQQNLLKNQFDQGLITEEEYLRKSEKLNEEAFEKNKNVSIAEAIISTIQGGVDAFTSTLKIDPTGITGTILAGLALAAGYAQVNAIRSTTFESPNAGSSSIGSGGGASALANIPTGGGAPGGLFDTVGGGFTTLTSSGGVEGPTKMYVLAGDVTSAQAANARIKQRRKL